MQLFGLFVNIRLISRKTNNSLALSTLQFSNFSTSMCMRSGAEHAMDDAKGPNWNSGIRMTAMDWLGNSIYEPDDDVWTET